MAKSNANSGMFTKRLQHARELRELSQAELAQRTGLQPAAISHFETGSRKPSFDNLRRLAEALAVSSDYLLGRSDDPEGAAANLGDPLYRDFSKINSDQDRAHVRALAEMLVKRQKPKKRGD